MLGVNQIYHSDIFALCQQIEDQSIDMILCDLPYGVTALADKWDVVIPFEPMWEQFKRVIKPRGAIVLTASQPFTSRLVSSNYEMFRYEWIWVKDQGVNFQLVKHQPQKVTESVLVFSKDASNYYPQGLESCHIIKSNKGKDARLGHISIKTDTYIQSWKNYPTNILNFNREVGLHPHPKTRPAF